jgi:DNA ligase-1
LDLEKIYKIVLKLQNTPGRLDKMAILKKYKDDQDFRFWLKVNLDPFWIFGIQDKKIKRQLDVHMDSPFDDFKTMITYLKAHNTGRDIDCQKVAGFLNTFDDEELKQFTLDSVCKKVRLGASVKVVNSVFEKGFISSFELQLAKKYVEEQSKIDKDEILFATIKLDGIRCANFHDQGITFFTRQGQPILGLNDITQELSQLPQGFVLDGELLLDNPNKLDSATLYRETIKVVRKDGVKKNVIFNVFDIVDQSEWNSNNFTVNYEKRREQLDDLFKQYNFKWIKPVELLYKGTDRSYINQLLDKVVAEGKEGLMINRNLSYNAKRTNHLLKLKKFQTADVCIIDLVEGRGKYKGMLGAAVINFPCSDGTINKVEVGSGWSDELRKEVWNNKEKYINSIIEIGYFEISKNSKTGKESLRFPTMKRLRTDKTEESWY